MDAQEFLRTLDWGAPLPAGAIVALVPAGIIKRRPGSGLIATVLAAAGWALNPFVGLVGFSVALGYAVHSGHRTKATKDTFMVAAVLLPWVTTGLALEWAEPGSTGPAGWVARRPMWLAAICTAIVAGGMVLRRAMRPALDPVRHATPEMRRTVIKRDGDRCNYCGAKGTDLGVRLECDHIVPWSQGGPTAAANLQMLCGPCNSLKADKSDDDARRVFAKTHGYAAGSFPTNWLQRLIR